MVGLWHVELDQGGDEVLDHGVDLLWHDVQHRSAAVASKNCGSDTGGILSSRQRLLKKVSVNRAVVVIVSSWSSSVSQRRTLGT
jgi:hypothetical protein